MSLRSIIVSVLILVVPYPSLADAERAACHDRRLSGLELSRRDLRPAPTLSASQDNDFRVSSSIAPARFDQDGAQVVNLADGGWWVVWDDDRYGNRKILRQRFDLLGLPLDANELLAGSDYGANYVDPRLEADTLGRIYFSYRNQTTGMIYWTRYAGDGSIDDGPFLVNDTSLNSFAGPHDMTVFPDGQLIVVWENYSALGSTIEMRIFTPTGASFLGPTTVNADGGSANHWVPAVTHAPGSGFLVVWEDYRNGSADIYARQFTGAGSPVGGDFLIIPPPDNAAEQYSPRAAYSPFDRYVIGWVDRRAGQEIYVQRYDQIVGLVGGNQMISSGHTLVSNRELDLSVSSAGRLHVVWSASGADNSIQSLMLDSGLAPAGLPEALNLSDLGQRWGPASCFGDAENLALVWTEAVENDPDLALMLFDSQGDRLLADEVTVNDDQQGAHSVAAQIIPTSDWWNLVCFADSRHDQGDIFVRAISNAGYLAGPERQVNQDAGSALQSEPYIAVSAAHALVVWNDGRTLGGFSGQRIYGRFGSLPLGEFSGDEFLISDSGSLAVKSCPRAAMQADGTGLAAWLDKRDGSSQVYGRWLTADGNLDSDEFLISQPGVDMIITSLFLGCYASDRFNVVWLDVSAAVPTARVRVFGADQALLDSFNYSPGSPGVNMDEMAADTGPDGTVALFWIGVDNGVRRAFLTRLASDGAVITESFEITDSSMAEPTDPSVSVSNNGYISLTWIDRRDGRRLAYYRILDSDLTPLADNQPVSTTVPEFMVSPATDAYRGRAWFVWSDPRENGLNVYAHPLIYLPTDVDDDPPRLPFGFSLSQNYPNPFNPSTEIEFTIPTATHVELTVINSLGQTVTTLMDDIRSAGTHRVAWNGCNSNGDRVASGVYLYRLTAGEFTQTKKMLLLK